MENIHFIKPEERYIISYWYAFDQIARERRYLATTRAFPFAETAAFVRASMEKKIPFLLAIDEKTDCVIGWCDAQPENSHVGHLGIGLLPNYRGKGIGKELICCLLKEAVNFGYETIELEVRAPNRRAIALYEAVGFQQIERIHHGLTLDGMEEDVLVFRRPCDAEIK